MDVGLTHTHDLPPVPRVEVVGKHISSISPSHFTGRVLKEVELGPRRLHQLARHPADVFRVVEREFVRARWLMAGKMEFGDQRLEFDLVQFVSCDKFWEVVGKAMEEVN